ncbi:DUF1491 family protein [Sphingomonas montana]|uniref:DUF1491 family protein n=1 Tax=Sphingomonas montana TaxID=1843236 RepID=UPI001F0A077F|nr:DUF1491 family protein [Sphingomonas montana]
MTARLTAAMLVSAMVRRVQATGGNAVVLAKGDATAGAILILLSERGVAGGMVERVLGPHGYGLMPTGPADPNAAGAVSDYVARRRQRDPDLWVVELDGADAAQVAAETMG